MEDRRRRHGDPGRVGGTDDALELFEEAMRDVQPLADAGGPLPRRPRRQRRPARRPGSRPRPAGGFDVRRTGGHLEGIAPGVGRETLQGLRRGEVEPELRVDLHGFPETEARGELRDALRRARFTGLRCVLVIHGRGLRSPAGPVLKEALPRWLTEPPLAAWVVAFASAPGHLGGTGATLVLVRARGRGPGR